MADFISPSSFAAADSVLDWLDSMEGALTTGHDRRYQIATLIEDAILAAVVDTATEQMVDAVPVVATRVNDGKTELDLMEQCVLSLQAEESVDRIAEVRNAAAFYAKQAGEIKKLCNKVLIERIESTGEDIVLSADVRLYVANPPKYSVRNMAELVQQILNIAGGDFAALVGCMSSNAIKPGATKSLFEQAGQPKLFDEMFITKNDPVLKDGKPAKKLLETNAFTKRKRPPAGKRIGLEDVELDLDSAAEEFETEAER